MSEERTTPKPLKTKIGIEDGRVVLLWDENIAWLSLEPDAAEQLAHALIQRADECRKKFTNG